MFFDELNCHGESTALIDEYGNTLCYSELSQFAEKMKEYVPARSFVICLCENSIGSAAGYLAFLHQRIIPLLLDKNINEDFLDSLVQLYQPEYLYIPETLYSRYSNYTCIHKEYGFCILKTMFEAKEKPYDELALLLTTSGSTGSPKLVRQSYKNLESNAVSIAEYLNIDKNQRAITVLPMNYTYGLSIINSHIKAGAAVILTVKSVVEASFWELMKKEHATSLSGVPFIYETLKKMRFFQMQLPDLQYMTQAGGKLSFELQKEFTEYAIKEGKKFIVMYGQTEATARMSYLPFSSAKEKCGSIGIAIPGGKLSLIDADGNIINEPDRIGELLYEGDNVTLGYALCREDFSKEDERHGKLLTGDMAKRDADGFYYIAGRKKRFLKLMGNRVNLDEIEQLLKQKYSEVDIAAAGKDDHLIIYATTAGLEEEIIEFLMEKIHINSHTGEVRFIRELPRNEAGKILYQKLNED